MNLLELFRIKNITNANMNFTTSGRKMRCLLRLFQERDARPEVNWRDFDVYFISRSSLRSQVHVPYETR